MPVRLKGAVELDAFIDQGSDITLIDVKLYEELKPHSEHLDQNFRPVRGAGDSLVKILGRISIPTTLYDPLHSLSYTRDLSYLVTPILPPGIIIGLDSMQGLITSLDLEHHQVVFSKNAVPDFAPHAEHPTTQTHAEHPPAHTHTAPLTLAVGIRIAPGLSAMVSCTFPALFNVDDGMPNSALLFEPQEAYTRSGRPIKCDFLAHATTLGVIDTEQHWVHLTNTGDTCLDIGSGKQIGTVQCVSVADSPTGPTHTPETLITACTRAGVFQHYKGRRAQRSEDKKRRREEGVKAEKARLAESGQTAPIISPHTAAHVRRHALSSASITRQPKRAADYFTQSIAAAEQPARCPEAPDPVFADLDVDPQTTDAQKAAILALLRRYQEVFRKVDISEPAPRATGVEFRINTEGNVPVKQAPYRHPPAAENVIQAQVDDLVKLGLVVPSFSPWGSPVILVAKKDGSQRMCIDYRRMNALTKKDGYPLPRIDDCLDRCRLANWLSIMDLADAYHHLPMHPDSEAQTAFVTRRGLYHWKVMPYGATGCPGAFQRYVDNVLRGLPGDSATAYFDDIMVHTHGSFEQHLLDIERVLERLRDHNLRAKIKKCHWAYKKVLFVGHLVENGTIRPDPEKIKAVQDIAVPRDTTHLKSFLGLANYYRKFISNFAGLAIPLYKLLKKGVEYIWTRECDTSFEGLKKALVDAPCLYAPDFDREFILQTDASGEGISGVLVQDFGGEEHPVAFVSRQLNTAEKNYATTELEALAVVWSIKQFEHYLVDKHFTVVTDHHALRWLPTKASPNKRLQRWFLLLSQYDFNVLYRKGTENANADGLSRNPVGEATPIADPITEPREVTSVPLFYRGVYCRSVEQQASFIADPPLRVFAVQEDSPVPTEDSTPSTAAPTETPAASSAADSSTQAGASAAPTEEAAASPLGWASDDASPLFSEGDGVYEIDPHYFRSLIEAQQSDKELQPLLDYMKKQEVPQQFDAAARARLIKTAEHHDIDPVTGALYNLRQTANRTAFHPFQRRLVIPKAFQGDIMELFHKSAFGGHVGVRKTYQRISVRYDWVGMYADVKHFVMTCKSCLLAKAKTRKAERDQPRMPVPQQPFDVIAVDYIGPLKVVDDMAYLLVIVDMFSGWAIAVPTMNCTADTSARVMTECVFSQFGYPRVILADNAFNPASLQNYLKSLGIHSKFMTPLHPATNGTVERLNTIKSLLRAFSNDFGEHWPRYVCPVVFAYNTSPKEPHGLAPYFVLFGRDARLPGEPTALDTDEVTEIGSYPAEYEYLGIVRRTIQSAQEFVARELKTRRNLVQAHDPGVMYPVYKIGDTVFIADDKVAKKGLFVNRYQGPYVILKRIGSINYDVAPVDKRTAIRVVHVDRIKPYNIGSQPDFASLNDKVEPPFTAFHTRAKRHALLADENKKQSGPQPLQLPNRDYRVEPTRDPVRRQPERGSTPFGKNYNEDKDV